jgi:hypothetical protein
MFQEVNETAVEHNRSANPPQRWPPAIAACHDSGAESQSGIEERLAGL